MRLEPLHSGIEFELRTIVSLSLSTQPVEQRGPVSARPLMAVGDEIIDVENPPGDQLVEVAETRDGGNSFRGLKGRQMEASLLHRADPGDKFTLHQMRSELLHDRKTTGDLGAGLSKGDGHGCLFFDQARGRAERAVCVVMRATDARMMADATKVLGVMGSPSTSQPRKTATIGLTYA